MRLMPFALAALLTGCGGPMLSQVGPGTYMASGGSVYGNTSLAAETCRKQGRIVKITQMEDRYEGGHAIFRCLSPTDPESKSPTTFRKDPNIVIQDNRGK